jgi:hypothetical protein
MLDTILLKGFTLLVEGTVGLIHLKLILLSPSLRGDSRKGESSGSDDGKLACNFPRLEG